MALVAVKAMVEISINLLSFAREEMKFISSLLF
jgi:hypothetical protein